MKAYIVNDLPFTSIEALETPNHIFFHDICVTLKESLFTSAHNDCGICKTFCSNLRKPFQLNSCDTDESECGLEIKMTLDRSSQKFDVKIEGDILETLCRYLGPDERIWLKVKIANATYYQNRYYNEKVDLPDLASNKLDMILVKGKYSFNGTMRCTETWRNFWFKENQTFEGKINVIVGIDNVFGCGVNLAFQFYDENNLNIVNKTILEGQVASDLTLCTANGAKLPCHISFLEVHSPTFAAMLKDSTFVEGQTNTIILDDMTEEGAKALLKYLYYRDIQEPTINPSVAVELLTCANKYGIEILGKSIRALLLSKPNDWYDINTGLRLFFFACQVETAEEFKKKAIQILQRTSLQEVKNSSDYNELFSENPLAAQDLCTALLSTLSLNK